MKKVMPNQLYDLHLRQLNKTIEFRGSVLSIFTSREKLYVQESMTEVIPSCLVVSSRLKKLPHKARTEIIPSRFAVTVCLCEKRVVTRIDFWGDFCIAFLSTELYK